MITRCASCQVETVKQPVIFAGFRMLDVHTYHAWILYGSWRIVMVTPLPLVHKGLPSLQSPVFLVCPISWQVQIDGGYMNLACETQGHACPIATLGRWTGGGGGGGPCDNPAVHLNTVLSCAMKYSPGNLEQTLPSIDALSSTAACCISHTVDRRHFTTERILG